MKKCRLFFLPYAGGSSTTFRNWHEKLDEKIEFCIYEMPGHGKRIREPFVKTMEELLQDLYTYIEQLQNDDLPYYIAGHCMGAVLAYELCYILKARNLKLPEMLLLSGHATLENTRVDEKISEMTREQMIQQLLKDQLITKEMLIDELLNLIIPPIQADAFVYENYIYDTTKGPLDINLKIIYGSDDPKALEEEVYEWSRFQKNKVEYTKLEGNHYFILNNPQYIDKLNKYILKD